MGQAIRLYCTPNPIYTSSNCTGTMLVKHLHLLSNIGNFFSFQIHHFNPKELAENKFFIKASQSYKQNCHL